jgi:hypothetical protein
MLGCTTHSHVIKARPRVFVTSDIGNEPDDSESLVRYLLYCSEFRTEGLVACTSTHQRTSTRPDLMHVAVCAYAQVLENFNAHTPPGYPYPDAQSLSNLIQSGPPVYGREALNQDIPLAEGTELLVNALDASDEPLWVLCWGGSNVIAQALQHVKLSRSKDELDKFISKLRIYMISDRDDTGPWIRVNFPHVLSMVGASTAQPRGRVSHVLKESTKACSRLTGSRRIYSLAPWAAPSQTPPGRLRATRRHSCISSLMV